MLLQQGEPGDQGPAGSVGASGQKVNFILSVVI